jgi:hypothetical protein
MTLRTLYIFACISLTNLISCTNEKIETEQSLKKETLDLIKSLGLLDDNEQILKYYSNFEKEKAGNFFTTKRIAHYWLDEYDKAKNDTSFAFYNEIAFIDTLYQVPDTFAPYMTITKKDSSKFRVYVGGKKNEMKSFFEDAIMTWKKSRN